MSLNMISPVFYIISLRSPKTRPRLVILDAQSDPNYEVVILDTGGCGCARRSEVSGTVRLTPARLARAAANAAAWPFIFEPC
jgi:hypothetical protein